MQHLEDGLVIGNVIECPLHQGRFEISSGKALSAPVCEDLVTYPVKVEGDQIYIQIV
ncbi:Rieske 2Fe-2S domain-containing protein [Aliamphritea spongicola]|nr:Rieske 2Fe-2S domain-containing protein [Aliamphritea spongicola]